MIEKYSIDEILSAVNDLQKMGKRRKPEINKVDKKNINSKIPINTLKLIEEAESFKK
jgi:hypothetical protein|tara:strand:- start:2018 stop:2188 length:171 start_codon:yes stop_codon:yes gene_type:complete